MEYRQLGRTGIKVGQLSLGCMMLGGETSLEDSCAIIDRAIDAGVNLLDTANAYHDGHSEEVIGEALQRNGKRRQIILSTKVFAPMSDDANDRGNSRRHIIEQCDECLRRLKTDWIDLFQIHRPMSEIPIDETLRALDDCIRAGKVRYIGSSTFPAWRVAESIWVSKELHLNRFVCEQPPYHILDRRIERELLPMAQTYGLGIITWSPLAGGMLTGKYSRANRKPSGTRYGTKGFYPISEQAFDVLEGLAPLVKAKGCTMSQFALAWCMSNPAVTSPLLGPRTMEQLTDNLGALDITITQEDKDRVDELIPPGTAVSNFYTGDFAPCKYHWM